MQGMMQPRQLLISTLIEHAAAGWASFALRSPAEVWNEHASILEAMAEGDAETAAELMRRHLVDAQDRVRTIAGASPS